MKKIAVIRRNGLGDLLCTLPLLKLIKMTYPQSHLTLFVDKRNSYLLPYLDLFDASVILPEKGNKYWNLFKSARRFHKKFDLAFSAKTSPMKLMNFFLWVLQAKERVAYVDSQWHSKGVNCPRYLLSSHAHQALRALRLLDPFKTEVDAELFPKINLPLDLFQSYPFPVQKHPTILISASTTLQNNRLHPQIYASILNQLYKSGCFHVRLISEKKDISRAESIASSLQMPYSLHFPRNFEEFMVLLSLSDLYFVGDGGVAHLGAALNKSVVVLFGGNDPKKWTPLGKKVISLHHSEHVDGIDQKTILENLLQELQGVESGRNIV